MPSNIEDFVHRVGRTGRAGKKGDAYSFLGNELPKFLKDMRFVLMRSGIEVPECLDRLAGPIRGRHGPIGFAKNFRGGGGGGGGYGGQQGGYGQQANYGGIKLHGDAQQRSYSGSPVASGAPAFPTPASPVAAAYTPSDSKRKREDEPAAPKPAKPAAAKPSYVKNARTTFSDSD
eukprot:143962_1